MKGKLVGLFALLSIFNISSHGAQGTGEDEAWGSGGSTIIPKELDDLPDGQPNNVKNIRYDKHGLQGLSDARLYGHGTLSNETVAPLGTIDNAQRSNNRIGTISALKMDMDDVAKRKVAAHEEYRKAGYPLLKLKINANESKLSPHARSLRRKYLDLKQEYKDLGKELAHLRAVLQTGE